MEQKRREYGNRIGLAKSGVLAFFWGFRWSVDGVWGILGVPLRSAVESYHGGKGGGPQLRSQAGDSNRAGLIKLDLAFWSGIALKP
jgi:hypothetical protein